MRRGQPQGRPQTIRNWTNYVSGWLLILMGLGTLLWVDFMGVWTDRGSFEPGLSDVVTQILGLLGLSLGGYSLFVRPKLILYGDGALEVVNPVSRWRFTADMIRGHDEFDRFPRIYLTTGKRIWCIGGERLFLDDLDIEMPTRTEDGAVPRDAEVVDSLRGGLDVDAIQLLLLTVIGGYYLVGFFQ